MSVKRSVGRPKINSRNKGNAFERKLAKEFTDWSRGILNFRRSPLSGGWEPKAQTGDIFPIGYHDSFPLIIEVRKNEKYTLDNILTGSCVIDKWFTQKNTMYKEFRQKHKLAEKHLVFIMSRNNVDPVVVVDGQHFNKWLTKPIPYATVVKNSVFYVIYPYNDFIKSLNFDLIYEEIQTRENTARESFKTVCKD